MLFVYINNIDRTEDYERNSLTINYAIQQRSNKCSFDILTGSKPVENQDLKLYTGSLVASHSGDTIVLKEFYQKHYNLFRAGETIFLDLDTVVEKATILSVDESTNTIILTEAPSVTLTENDKIGGIIYGGVVARVEDENLYTLENIIYKITGVSYDKVFDKKLTSDTYQDVNARYIINDFVNRTVNFNSTINDLSYEDNAEIQANITEGADGSNPTVDASDYLEINSSANLAWTYSGGSATFTGTLTAKDISQLVGVTTGTPIKGELMLWVKTSDYDDITNIQVKIGSDNSNYALLTFELRDTTDWQYCLAKFINATITGTPNWQAVDYYQIIINETASGSVLLNGLRVNQSGSFTLFNVQPTVTIEAFSLPQERPTSVMQRLSKAFEFIWYIDFEKDIHFQGKDLQECFYDITDTSNNFFKFSLEVDASQSGNRIIVFGGERQSDSDYFQHFQGNNISTEWVLQNKFGDLSVLVDDNTTTDTMEAGTNTTTVNATAHGLTTGDSITNRTRNATRVITVITPNQFTVEEVDGQTSGDTFTHFNISKTVGIDGLVDASTVDYTYNTQSQSVKKGTNEPILIDTFYIRFKFKERVPIRIQYTDPISVAALKALGNYGDGIIDLDPIRNENITDTSTALLLAQAKVNEYANAVFTGKFDTNFNGFKVADLFQAILTDRNLNNEFVIQAITAKQRAGEFSDYFEYSITYGTTLYGVIEFYQKLLEQEGAVETQIDSIVENFISAQETVEFVDEWDFVKNDQPWQWETSTGQPVPTRWDLFQWG